MAMIAELRRRRAEFRLHYCTRSPGRPRFWTISRCSPHKGLCSSITTAADPTKGLDLAATLRECRAGTHLYYAVRAG